jgi:nucleoid-associated protein YgaU
MIEGDSLQSIAYRELGKAAYWRAIADLNGIDDPLRVTAGTVLLIPSVADAARAS